jgi:hypothetical protein
MTMEYYIMLFIVYYIFVLFILRHGLLVDVSTTFDLYCVLIL